MNLIFNVGSAKNTK